MTRQTSWIALCAAIGLALSGCSHDAGAADPDDPHQLQIFTSWTSGTNAKALDGLLGVFASAAPEVTVLDESVAGSREFVDSALTARMDANNPPDTAAISVGSTLRTRSRAGELQDLTNVLAAAGLSTAFDEELLELVSYDNRVYGIPTAVQRVNVLWWNTSSLKTSGIDALRPAADLDSWLADLATLRDAGSPYPLALGDVTSQMQLFETVLIADLGADQYQALWREDLWNSPELVTAIDHFAELVDYADPSTRSLPQSELARLVIDGEAAYAVLSGESLPDFQEAGYEQGLYRSGPTPGTSGVFDLRADAFALPIGAGHSDAAKSWLSVVASVEGQQAVAAATHGVAARIGASYVSDSAFQVDTKRSLDTDRIVPSLSGGIAAPPAWTDDIADSVEQFVRDRRQKALFNALVAAAEGGLAR